MWAGVGLTVHLRLSEAPWSFASWNQSALMSRCFTQPDPRLVIVPRAAAESLCTRSGRCPTDFLKEVVQLIDARCCSSCYVPLCFATGEGGGTRFKPRLSQSDHEARAALAFRLLCCPIAFCERQESRYAFCVPAGNGHARCGFMHDVPHDARCSDQCFTRRMSDFSHDILERICRSILTASK